LSTIGPALVPGFSLHDHPQQQRENVMIYELRTYTVRPGTLGEMVKAASTLSVDIRKNDYGKLEGYWTTEIGPLNQVMHMWSYSDLNERERLRGELSKNARWTGEYIPVIQPLLMRQEVRLLNAIRPPVAPSSTGNIYEFRNYRAKPIAGTRDWLAAFTEVLPAREKHSKIVGLWRTEADQPNEVCHIWAYPSLNARAEVRANALKDPAWQAFLAKSQSLLEEMHSTIMLPAPHSPLK
jgi:hypothetical protein